MQLNHQLIQEFEAGLNPLKPEDSKIKANIVGCGEISTIFRIGNDDDIAYKRMPLFSDSIQAKSYQGIFLEYCELLDKAGVYVPDTQTSIVKMPDRPVILYIAQQMLPPERFGHKLIHTQDIKANERLMQLILETSQRLWEFCEKNGPNLEIAVDGQLSNWVHLDDDKDTIVYIDTSTPFLRKQGIHQMDKQIVLKTVPALLRWLITEKTANEVMDRYYEPRKNMIDLVANLYKEQKPSLIEPYINLINPQLPAGTDPITIKDVKSYYREDKSLWALFLRLRRFDRWFTSTVRRKRYEYILPGKIKR
ncbi:MAG: DUF6206 family protein [Thermodesulfobacteriota bacterium]